MRCVLYVGVSLAHGRYKSFASVKKNRAKIALHAVSLVSMPLCKLCRCRLAVR